MIYLPAKLGGRCANGYERGQGKRIHAHQSIDELKRNRYVIDRSVCGQKAGARSVGWTLSDGKVDCPKCLRIIDSQEVREEQESNYLNGLGV